MWGLSLLRSKLLVFVPLLLILGGIVVACGDDATPTAPATSTSPAPTATSPAPTATSPAPTATSPGPTATSPAPTATPVPEFFLKAPEANPKYGGTARWNVVSGVAHFDMRQTNSVLNVWASAQTFDNLVRFDSFSPGISTVVPDLAKEWNVSDDGLTYTFFLRDGVKFHDGSLLTAEDVRATFDSIINPPEGLLSAKKEFFEGVTAVNVIDPLTVEFKLSEPRGLLLKIIALPANAIMHKKTLEENNYDLKRAFAAPGTGPFIAVDHIAGERIEYEKNPNYWNPGLPHLDGLVLNNTSWGPPTGAAFLAGQCDLCMGLDITTWDKMSGREGINLLRFASASPQQIVLNLNRPPFNDARVRKALHLGLDYTALRASAAKIVPFGDQGWVAAADDLSAVYWPTAKEQPGWRKTTPEDIAEAKKLLADAGFPEGIKDVVIRGRDAAAPRVVLTTAQGLMRQILGIESELIIADLGPHYENMRKGDFDMAETGAAQPLPTVQIYWANLFVTGAASNWSFYSSKEFDDNFKNIVRERDPDKLKALVLKGTEILDRDMPVLNWGHPWIHIGWVDEVKGMGLEFGTTPDMSGRLRWDTAWLDQ